MNELLPAVVEQLLADGIGRIGAVVNRQNIAAKKVLKKARFKKIHASTSNRISMKLDSGVGLA